MFSSITFNKSAKYEKLGKHWPYCTRNLAKTNSYIPFLYIFTWPSLCNVCFSILTCLNFVVNPICLYILVHIYLSIHSDLYIFSYFLVYVFSFLFSLVFAIFFEYPFISNICFSSCVFYPGFTFFLFHYNIFHSCCLIPYDVTMILLLHITILLPLYDI